MLSILKTILGSTLLLIFWLINAFGGVVGAIWLIAVGFGKYVFLGLIATILAPYILGLLYLVVTPVGLLAFHLSKKIKNHTLALLPIFPTLILNFIILSLWVYFITSHMFIPAGVSIIPVLLWGYSVITAPLAYMLSKEPQDSYGSVIGILFADILYILIVVNKFFFYITSEFYLIIGLIIFAALFQLVIFKDMFKQERMFEEFRKDLELKE